MTLLAALAAGAFVYLAVGLLLGVSPLRRLGRARRSERRLRDAQVWLNQAGVRLSPVRFVAGSVLVGAAAFLVLAAIAPSPAVALVPAIALGALPAAWFARQRAQRLRAVQLAWPDALRELSSAISAGMSLDRALVELATVGPEPIRVSFARFPVLARMLGPVPALEVIKEELAHPTSDRVIEVLVLAHRRGGQVLLGVLEELIDATTDDLNVQEELKTNALEGKINARIVFALPWLVLLLITARPGPFQAFYSSRPGQVVIVLAAVWSLFGLALTSKLSKLRGEPRVFGAPAGASTPEPEPAVPGGGEP